MALGPLLSCRKSIKNIGNKTKKHKYIKNYKISKAYNKKNKKY